MPDFANITNPLTLESIGIAAAAWAFFMILAPYMAQRTGVKFEEPPVWLYSRSFSAIRVLSLLVAAYLGALFPLGKDITAHLADLAIPFGLAAGFAVAVGLIIAGGVWMWRRMKARQEAVVLEPLTAGGILLRGLILIVIVGVFIGGPWTLREYAGVDIIGPLFGGEGGGSGYAADLGAFLGLLLTFVLFWVVPNIVADRLENMDISPIWASTSGLEFFRWNLLGLVLLLTTGVLGFTAALDPYFKRPVFWPICVAIPSAGAVIYIVFWALPMRSLGRLAAEGDYLAKDLLSRVRFSGASAWIVYKRRSHGRAKSLSGDDQKRLCPTCLRPIHDISLYKNLKFDHCPHCQSFMPPVFTMLDYVNHQSGRLMPLIEDQGPPGAITKKKKIRAEDEDRLVQDLLRALFALAVSERGTDLHFVVEGEKVAIRCRTDGVLYTMMQFEKVMAKPLISAVKVMANLDITERRKPQDGSFKIDVGERSIDVRINTSPVPEGEMASMRLLYAHSALGSLDKLEMGSRNTKLLTKLIHSPSGLILVTGPTGSG
ncbi:Flp pilus assembly complex ATPase component TadA, partial [Candidatus Sumerlaeota bacterium]|nr:Flp pilus assembly complex ATPase component TadA [Candidatus Sumerlaeota bacterium]